MIAGSGFFCQTEITVNIGTDCLMFIRLVIICSAVGITGIGSTVAVVEIRNISFGITVFFDAWCIIIGNKGNNTVRTVTVKVTCRNSEILSAAVLLNIIISEICLRGNF